MTHPPASITVITPSLNQIHHLSALLETWGSHSGASQGRVRHIVIDGGSTDGSVDLLRRTRNVEWISEPDAGQADAINKGLAMVESELVGWLNCDDRHAPGALDFVIRAFDENPEMQFMYGDALAVDSGGRQYGLRAHVRACGLSDLTLQGDPIVQPAAFWRTSLMSSVGLLEASLTYAFDYEYWMRVASVTSLVYVPVCLAVEALHGESKTSRGGHLRMAEIDAVARHYGGPGVPLGFRSEAAALATLAAVRESVRGDIHAARHYLTSARELRPEWKRYVAHLLAETLPGVSSVPRLRLLANRWRSRRPVQWPTDPEVMLMIREITRYCREPP